MEFQEKRLKEKGPPPKSQRPQQSFKRRVQPPKPESTKPISKETKVVPKVPAKTSGVHDSSSGSSRKPETKTQEEVKKPVPQPLPAPVEPQLKGGYSQLNARMTKMVETELRDIMIKVWQELPDNPPDLAEALVVDKLRNQAGEYLRNVLGLNITKRLLNVHNPLYVKVQFSGKPEKVHLGEFLKKYNFIAFKRIETTVNMFAAQVKTINDFDKICSATDIRCGDIKVTVTPMYKFTKCPPNLVTSFYDHYENASDEPTETTEKEEKPDKSPEKDVAKTENVLTKPNEETKSENTTKEKVVNKPVENKTVANKLATENKAAVAVSKPAVENKAVVKPMVENKAVVKPAAENKTTPNETVLNKTAVNNTVNKTAVNNTVNKTLVKPTAEKPVVNNKPAANKTAAVEKPAAANKAAVANKPATANKITVANKPAAANKAAVANKPAAANKAAVANKPAAENKAVVMPVVGINEVVQKPPPKPAKTPVKATAKTPVKATVKTPVKANTNKQTDDFDDNDELDDRDILALMSEGIVLDECSGSDEE